MGKSLSTRVMTKNTVSKMDKSQTKIMLDTAAKLARDTCADMILLVTHSGIPPAAVQKLNTTCRVLVATRAEHFPCDIEKTGAQRLICDYDGAHFERVRQCVIKGMDEGHIRRGARLVCLSRLLTPHGVDALMVLDTDVGFDGYDPADIAELSGDLPVRVVKTVLNIALDIGRDGREGEPVGTFFVIGDSERVLRHSRSMTFDPFRGYSDEEKDICNPDIHEGVKEVALMDGAFVVRDDGIILSGGRYISANVQGLVLPKGLGARHVAAASITKTTHAIAVAVSQSTGTVRAFKRGQIVLQLNADHRHIRQDRR